MLLGLAVLTTRATLSSELILGGDVARIVFNAGANSTSMIAEAQSGQLRLASILAADDIVSAMYPLCSTVRRKVAPEIRPKGSASS